MKRGPVSTAYLVKRGPVSTACSFRTPLKGRIAVLYIFMIKLSMYVSSDDFWPGLGLPRPKAIVVIPQNQPLPKHLRKKTSKSAKHACHYATKERPVKITMYLGLDIIIKIKFTTIFDRCATLNVLNYLTKNFES